jgi:hypothetical protein
LPGLHVSVVLGRLGEEPLEEREVFFVPGPQGRAGLAPRRREAGGEHEAEEIRIGRYARKEMLGAAVQVGDKVMAIGGPFPHALQEGFETVGQDGLDQAELGAEVVVQGRLAERTGKDDLGNPDPVVAAGGEEPDGRLEQELLVIARLIHGENIPNGIMGVKSRVDTINFTMETIIGYFVFLVVYTVRMCGESIPNASCNPMACFPIADRPCLSF